MVPCPSVAARTTPAAYRFLVVAACAQVHFYLRGPAARARAARKVTAPLIEPRQLGFQIGECPLQHLAMARILADLQLLQHAAA